MFKLKMVTEHSGTQPVLGALYVDVECTFAYFRGMSNSIAALQIV